MRIIVTIVFLAIALSLQGQNKKAKRILDRMSKQYTSAQSMEISFDLIVTYPEEPSKTYPSQVIQRGNKFLFRNSEQEYYGNGKAIWVYLPDKNEVQINDFDEEEAADYFITPLDLLDQYKSGDYEYDLVAERKADLDIEFIPIDEFSDYSKFRLTIQRKDDSISQITAFGKDGSKVILELKDILRNKSYADLIFEFDPAKYPGVRIEDLRLD